MIKVVVKRVFRLDRLYKIFKWFINSVCIVFILWGIYGYMNEANGMKVITDIYNNCTSSTAGERPIRFNVDGKVMPICEYNYSNNINSYKAAVMHRIVLGIFILILFYGSVALLKYLFPKMVFEEETGHKNKKR